MKENDNKELKDDQDISRIDIFSNLDDLDRAIITRRVKGMKFVDIAKELGVNRQTVSARLKKEKAKRALEQLQKTAIDLIMESATFLVNKSLKIAKDGKEEVALRACLGLLKKVIPDAYTFTGTVNTGEKRLLDYAEADDVDALAEYEGEDE